MNRQVSGVVIAAVALFLLPVYAAAQGAPAQKDGAKKAESSAATPRTPDGHPDLNGVWGGNGGGGGDEGAGNEDSGDIAVNLATRTPISGESSPIIFNRDNTILRRMDPNRPMYKPQYWDQIQSNDQNGNNTDPSYGCMPAGVPRMGPPRKIVETPTEIILFYQGPDTYRLIPTDGRPHTPDKDLEGTWMGEPRGRWDGDTLVIDSVGFNDTSWLDIAGYFHTENLHMIERIHREGNNLIWQATADDPEVLIKPWVLNARTLKLNGNPHATLDESLPCIELDQAHLVTKEHH